MDAGDLAYIKIKLDTIEEDVKELKKEISDLRDDVQSLREDSARTETIIQTLKNGIKRVESDIKDVEKELDVNQIRQIEEARAEARDWRGTLIDFGKMFIAAALAVSLNYFILI